MTNEYLENGIDLYIDMDDTLVNYSKRFNQMKEIKPNMEYPQAEYGFFLSLEPLPYAVETIKLLINNPNINVYFANCTISA